MIVGIPRETKEQEYRIAISPIGIDALKKDGHEVVVEEDAGVGAGITDQEIAHAGARIVPSHEEVFERAE